MPNLSKILDEHPDIRAAITMDDGCIYGLPAGEQMGTAGVGKAEDYNIYTIPQYSMINKTWLDELGLEVPTTLDELHDVLVAFIENDMATMYGNDAGADHPDVLRHRPSGAGARTSTTAGFGFTNWTNDRLHGPAAAADGTVNFVSDDDKLPRRAGILPRLVHRGADRPGSLQPGRHPVHGQVQARAASAWPPGGILRS